MNDKDKLIQRIIKMEKRLFIPIHVDTIEELQGKDITTLERINRMNEQLHSIQSSFVEEFVSCTLCGLYLSTTEKKQGKCMECKCIDPIR